jgi:hypothetical protein
MTYKSVRYRKEVQALDAPPSAETEKDAEETHAIFQTAQRAAPPAVASVGLPEAPASVNVYVEIGGRKVQVTLRDMDE